MKNRFERFLSDANLSKFSILLLLFAGAGIVLLPLGIVGAISLIPFGQTLEEAIFHQSFTRANYWEAWRRGTLLVAFPNSSLVAIAVTAFQIFTSTLAGYTLVWLGFRGQKVFLC